MAGTVHYKSTLAPPTGTSSLTTGKALASPNHSEPITSRASPQALVIAGQVRPGCADGRRCRLRSGWSDPGSEQRDRSGL